MTGGAIAQGTLTLLTSGLAKGFLEFNVPDGILNRPDSLGFYIAKLKSGKSNIYEFIFYDGNSTSTVVKTTEGTYSFYNAAIGFVSTTSFQFKNNPEHFTIEGEAIYDIYEAI